mgnify:CR=1 FL=1
MKLSALRINNFQSFGPNTATIQLEDDITYVLGPNGAGKTAVLQALSRLFSPIQSQRAIQVSDFHRPVNKMNLGEQEWLDTEPELWIEAEFTATAPNGQFDPSVPEFFKQMSLQEGDSDGLPKMKVRLTAKLANDGVVDEKIEYILREHEDGTCETHTMPRNDRNKIAVYYLPARRNPNEQITYTASSLMGRALRAADWQKQREELSKKFAEITHVVEQNNVITSLSEDLEINWKQLHKGIFFTDPALNFGSGELESILRQITISFSPSHTEFALPVENLSDGQKSLLYFSIILAWISLTQKVVTEGVEDVDPTLLNPPAHTIIAVEEPENSLAPHYLGRITKQLRETSTSGQVQSVIATHTPTLLKRVEPTAIRFLRLDGDRRTSVHCITLPEKGDEAAKYVNEAVKAYPELYFSRLVILGEGDSEMLVLPRVLAASGIAEDDVSVSVVPLGGRHVNHFWRLLNDLEIPHVTLLDLDYGRYQGGYCRVKYVVENLYAIGTYDKIRYDKALKICNENKEKLLSPIHVKELEKRGIFFSEPIDLDMMMINSYPSYYEVENSEQVALDVNTIKSVLGKTATDTKKLPAHICKLFDAYRIRFKSNSKPATHINALAQMDDKDLLDNLPEPLERLVDVVKNKLKVIPE